MDDENSTKHVLQGRELIDYLVEKTSSTANAELLQREERRNRRMTILLSILMAVGIGGAVSAIKMLIKDQMQGIEARVEGLQEELNTYIDERAQTLESHFEEKVEMVVAKDIDRKVGEVRTLLEQYKNYQEFLAISEIIESEVQNDKMPEESLQSAIKLAGDLAPSASITRQPRFLEAIKIVIDLLVRTDRNSEIDSLEVLLGEVLATDSKISQDLADHYGQVIISSPYPVEDLQREFEALSRYARSSRELNYPEKALMWELFVAYKRNQYQKSPTTNGMVEMVQDLNEADTRNLCYHVFLNSHPLHWMNTPDQEGRELARLVTKLLDDYPHFRQLVESQIATPELRPSIEALVTRKRERLERLVPESDTQTAESPESEDDNTLRR
ncbi:MAG: hypothetical protein GXP28_03130 [Planctomycetes bacterium]|nr:hypothetical protein [Planctomycetota bacterium]